MTIRRLACTALAFLAVSGALLVGCTRGPAAVSPSSPASAPATAATAPSAATTPTPSPVRPAELSRLVLSLTPKWRGFTNPLYLMNAGDGSGRVFVVEQQGTVRVIRDGTVARAPYLDLSSLVSSGGERGLLGLAFAPGFASNGRIYVNYTDTNGDTRIARYTTKDPASDVPTWGAPQTILHIPQPYPNHNGGCLQFGPDGLLYIGMGDGGAAGDPGNRAQDPSVLLGKMLRLDVESSAAAGKAYAIPAGQPVRRGWAPEVWMIGLRNPWRFSFDTAGGTLWIGDVGQDAWEEIDRAPAASGGQNWGWNVWEGDRPYPPGSSPSRSGFTFPVFAYSHPSGESVTGGYVYRGSKYPALVGTYLFADYIKGWVAGIRTIAPDGTPLRTPQERTLLQTSGQLSSFGVDEAGELYIVDYSGTVLAVAGTVR